MLSGSWRWVGSIEKTFSLSMKLESLFIVKRIMAVCWDVTGLIFEYTLSKSEVFNMCRNQFSIITKQKRHLTNTWALLISWHNFLLISDEIETNMSSVVMYNARFHHHDEVQAIFNDFSLEFVFPLPYSPFLNPIENIFNQLMHYVKLGYPEKAEVFDGVTLA